MPDARSFSITPTQECVETLLRWAHEIRELHSNIADAHRSLQVSDEVLINDHRNQDRWFDEHDLAIATALEALAARLENERSPRSSSRPFEFEYTFTRVPIVDGGPIAERIDLAFRITKVTEDVPITFVMRDKFLTFDNESVFCEAYLSDGSLALEQGGFLLGDGPKHKSLLSPGAAVFLRDIPESWDESPAVIEALAQLVEDCCKFDRGTQARVDLTEAMSQMFDLIDTGERLLRRNRNPVTVEFSDATAHTFAKYLVEFDAAVLSIGEKKPFEHGYTAIVLIEDKHRQRFIERVVPVDATDSLQRTSSQ